MEKAQNNGANTPLSKPLKSDFKDSDTWDLLADNQTHYRLPEWDVPCTVSKMKEWEKRLDISDYQEVTQTSRGDFIKLNPDWPLRAYVGLLLEYMAAVQ
jgi:hypothetical protein